MSQDSTLLLRTCSPAHKGDTRVMMDEPNGRGIEQEADRGLTVRVILYIFVEQGKLEDVGK
jgi:hypothetical protein